MNSNPPHEAWIWAALAAIALAAALGIAWAEDATPDDPQATPCTDRGGELVPIGAAPPEFACSLDLPPT